jgi:mRNA-degrading endonuclease toxin of MazEF toxin-antitoxin module
MAMEPAILLLALFPSLALLGWLAVVLGASARDSCPDWLFPLRGRWRECLVIGLPAVVLAVILPWPASVLIAACVAGSAGWWRLRRAVLTAPAPRSKSVATVSGILLIPETGGPLPDDLRFELDVWEAGVRVFGCSGVQAPGDTPVRPHTPAPIHPGDICWVRLNPCFADQELSCRRPAVVLQPAEEAAGPPEALVVPLVAELQALRLPGTVAVEPDADNGLCEPLVALVFAITAVDDRFLEPTRGRLSAATLEQIRAELERAGRLSC